MIQQESVAARLGGTLVDAVGADVGAARERARQRRLTVLALVLVVPNLWLWSRLLQGSPVNVLSLPQMPQDPILWVIPLMFALALGAVVIMPLSSGRSPHVFFRPEQIDVSFDDVKGLDPIVDEVIKTLNTFLGYAQYRERLGGKPRRGLLFEGPPGTGKTHLAKAMARHAGVPFLFVSATSFQSMWYGASARKIRSYFRHLRTAARREGGAIGFIEEIDAIATARGGMSSQSTPLSSVGAAGALYAPAQPCLGHATSRVGAVTGPAAPLRSGAGLIGQTLQVERMGVSESAGGVVNELLVQMQSFDTPPAGMRAWNAVIRWLNAYLPSHRQLRERRPDYNNILLIAATNRADTLDPALLRPGRFDRILSFEPPAKKARRELVDHFLSKKSHASELDEERFRDQLAGQTFGYTPVMIEHLLDEALVFALRSGRDQMTWTDIQSARLNQEVGLKNPVVYTELERQTVATHEAGHATVAYLAGTRRLEVLSIVKRSGSLGLLAHGDLDEVYTRSRSEMHALIDIALGGMCAEDIWFGHAGTGPGGDLVYATQLACEIVGVHGMGDSLVSLAAVQGSAFNNTNLVGRVLGDAEARAQVDRILTTSKTRVRALLEANRHLVEALRTQLLERDELVGDEIVASLQGAEGLAASSSAN